MTTELEEAAQIMADATSSFVLPAYGLEGLEALVAAGWTITPPAPPQDDRLVFVLTATLPDEEGVYAVRMVEFGNLRGRPVHPALFWQIAGVQAGIIVDQLIDHGVMSAGVTWAHRWEHVE